MGMLKQAQAKKSPVADAGSDDPTPKNPPQPQGAVPGQPANDGSQQADMDQDSEDQEDGGADEAQEGDAGSPSDPDNDGDDDSSPEGDTDNDQGQGDDQGDDNMSPQEEQELKQAALALHTVLFQNQGTGQAIVGMIQPAAKVDSTSKAGILLFKEMDKKLNLNNDIVPAFALVVADQLTDMGEKVKGIQYSDQELQAVAGAIIEGAIHIVGMSPQEAKQRLAAYSPQEQKQAQGDYQKFLSSAQGDSGQGDPGQGDPSQGDSSQGAGPAAPQGGADPGQQQAAPGGPPAQAAQPAQPQQDPQAGGQ